MDEVIWVKTNQLQRIIRTGRTGHWLNHGKVPGVLRSVVWWGWCGGAGVVGPVWWGWCGVVWCGVVWCGVVWCGVVWCGVVWCGVVWCGVVWCGECKCGVMWWG